MSLALDAIRPKIARLLPLLSSDKAGEVTATVAAIERTLKAGGCDWHALAAFIGDVPAPFIYAAPGSSYSRPAPPQPQSKPARQPSPWPSFSTLKHSQRCAWLDAISKAEHPWDKDKRNAFNELAKKMVSQPHECLDSKEFALFNRLVKLSWIMGVRP